VRPPFLARSAFGFSQLGFVQSHGKLLAQLPVNSFYIGCAVLGLVGRSDALAHIVTEFHEHGRR
jgi:hypothetical protein